MVVILGQQGSVGEKSTVILCTYINRHAGIPNKKQIQDRNNVRVLALQCLGIREIGLSQI